MENAEFKDSEDVIDEFDDFLYAHKDQLIRLNVPKCKWRTLCRKLKNSIFDAGNDFMYAQEDDDEETSSDIQWNVYSKCSMEPDDEDHIYLIDHAWTYDLACAKDTIEKNSDIADRLCSILNLSAERLGDNTTDAILKEMWKFNNSYILQKGNQATSYSRCWFLMDEFGSRINHSEQPTFSIVSFLYSGDSMMYSLLFPIVSVTEGDEVTYSYPGWSSTMSSENKIAIKYPWEPCDLSYVDYSQTEPDIDYFLSGRKMEILPDNVPEIPPLLGKSKIRVYTEYPEVSEHLKDIRFYFTNDKSKADILWLSKRLYDYKSAIEARDGLFYVNQFPSEQVLVNKDFLAVISRRSFEETSDCDPIKLESHPKWLPTTYSLMHELPQFVSYFQNREKRNLDNTWICKPYNLARGLDIFVTDNLTQIIRLSGIGPMVACKYVTDPVLFPKENVGLVKMDLRFIVLLRSVQDFELFVYDRFWLRFANKPFSLDNFEDYEKHFTVMNYSNFPLQQMFCHDFIKQFESYYSSYDWKDVEGRIYKMIKELFIAAAMKEPPAGLGAYPGSRAMYGLDIMLEWDRSLEVPEINPVILEVNWMPDCKRACDYYPEFYDDVFSVLFLNDISGKHVVQL